MFMLTLRSSHLNSGGGNPPPPPIRKTFLFLTFPVNIYCEVCIKIKKKRGNGLLSDVQEYVK